MNTTTGARSLLALEHVGKRFGSVSALDDVSVSFPAAAITCLLGDNGAGKSTLIRILSGVYAPTTGRCVLDGRPVAFGSPRAAQAHGIATVHQDLALVPLMSIWRNFFLGREPTRGWGPWRRLDVAAGRRVARAGLESMGIHVNNVDQPVGTLSGGERQSVAIARALHFGARVLILDEPTAALGVRQAELVLQYVVRAREHGLAVVFITHNPQHAEAVGDQFVVLRRGRVAGTWARGSIDAAGLAQVMSGAEAAD